MKKVLLALSLLIAIGARSQTATNVVISEIYGGGGNGGAPFANDFIELYNPTNTAISLSGWSVQYASSTGSTWNNITALSGTIPAKGFYLIQEAAGANNPPASALPASDATGTISMSATAGKVALVNTTTQLSGTCPTGTQIIDFVGYGSANCPAGLTSPTPPPSNTASVERKASAASTATTLAPGGSEVAAGNGYKSGNNNTDFVAQSSVGPQNSASPAEGGPVGNTVSVAAGTAPAEPATNGTFTITLSAAAPAGGVTITYLFGGTATAGTDYTVAPSDSITIPAGSTTGTLNINVIDDALTEGPETIIITLTTASGGYTLSGGTATLNLTDDDIGITLLHTIQGSGATATAGTFTAEAIVTGVYPGLSPAGFYMQEEDADADADTATSEGIFVVSSTAVAVGNKVQVTGTVQENGSTPSFGQAVLTNATVAVMTQTNALPTAVAVNLPVAAATDLEKYEGMLVQFPQVLTVTNNFTLGRFGEVGLSAGGLVYQPTQVTDPNDLPNSGTSSTGTSNVAAINALATANALRTILLDDGTATTTVLPYVDGVDSTLRIGSTTTNLTGIMGYAFGVYRVQPIPSGLPAFTYAPRPTVPSVGAPTVKIISFNVLNYFNGNGTGGGFPTSRGAHSLAEFNRQRAKIITAISQLNADVVGLTEIENDGTGTTSAIQDLVNGLNDATGPNTYSIINDGATTQANNTDEIRCGIIYKSAAVTPNGAVMISPAAAFSRPPVAQTFTSITDTSLHFNFIVNHFKSKGCSGSTGADLDQSDGQGCYNARRRGQSTALLTFISTTVIPTSGIDRVVTVGDYNAYEEEDPMDIFRSGNYTVLGDSSLYSYQFDGQLGSLDHAVISSNLSSYVTGFAKWNINAAEPVYLDYNDAVNDGGGDFVNPFASTYTTSAYRSSDHDPVLLGLRTPVPLPLSLLQFEAAKQEHTVKLRWTTAPTANVRNFVVERAAGSGEWLSIAQVETDSKNAAPVYIAIDKTPKTGENLYRLKIVNTNGSINFSATRKVSFHALSAPVSVYPNPATDVLHIVPASEAPVQVAVLNTFSQTVLTALGEKALALDVSHLAPGLYFVRIILADGNISVNRFSKR